jgi:hypothetical protein
MLVTGIACGFAAVGRGSSGWGALHVVAITYAATVRPMLAIYPFAAAGLHWVYIHSRRASGVGRSRIVILTLFLFTLVGVQAPAIRNRINHGVFTPSEIGSINLTITWQRCS